MKKTYLVTGGAGFIGSHLSERLAFIENKILIVDNLSNGFKENVLKHPNIESTPKSRAKL